MKTKICAPKFRVEPRRNRAEISVLRPIREENANEQHKLIMEQSLILEALQSLIPGALQSLIPGALQSLILEALQSSILEALLTP